MDARRKRLRENCGVLILPHDEDRPSHNYQMPWPGGDNAMILPVIDHQARWTDAESLTIKVTDLRRIIALAQGYMDLTTYELGQGVCVEKLKDLWRARRAIAKETE